MNIRELEAIMQEHGAVIRAIPLKTQRIYEAYHKHEFPDGQVIFLEAYNREMCVVESTPEHAGEFLIESVKSTTSTVRFARRYYASIEDAVKALLDKTAVSPNFTERKAGNTD